MTNLCEINHLRVILHDIFKFKTLSVSVHADIRLKYATTLFFLFLKNIPFIVFKYISNNRRHILSKTFLWQTTFESRDIYRLERYESASF